MWPQAGRSPLAQSRVRHLARRNLQSGASEEMPMSAMPDLAEVLEDRLSGKLSELFGLRVDAGDEWALAATDRAQLGTALLSRVRDEQLLAPADVQRVIPRRTWLRRKAGQPLSPAEFDGLYRLVRLQALAELVFDDAAQAANWLRQPKHRLSGATPLDFAADALGVEAIEGWLHEIDQGYVA
jgi:putative toxin-antitoxin system antitoxin component (TIGR02293 family)